jgi:hypothetical protein
MEYPQIDPDLLCQELSFVIYREAINRLPGPNIYKNYTYL